MTAGVVPDMTWAPLLFFTRKSVPVFALSSMLCVEPEMIEAQPVEARQMDAMTRLFFIGLSINHGLFIAASCARLGGLANPVGCLRNFIGYWQTFDITVAI